MKKIIHWYNMRNYPTDERVDACILNGLESGIKDLTYGESYIATCNFNNGVSYNFWNTNIPYAWLSKGCFYSGKKNILIYDDAMPSRKVMNKFYNAMYEFLLKK